MPQLSESGEAQRTQERNTRLSMHTRHPWISSRELEQACAVLSSEVKPFTYGGCGIALLGMHADRTAAGTVIRPHRHSHYEAILILSGRAFESAPPVRRLGPGSLQLHTPGELHAWTASSTPVLRIGISFTMTPAVPARQPIHWPSDPAFRQAAQTLLTDAMSSTPGRKERLTARLILLLAPALALLDLPEQPVPARSAAHAEGQRLTPLIEKFLVDNIAEPLTLSDVAAQFNLSVPTLTRRFRDESGSSVMARLQDIRMRHAADLLRARTLSVKEVGAAVGIPETSYFCRRFQMAFGRSPGRFSAKPPPGRTPIQSH